MLLVLLLLSVAEFGGVVQHLVRDAVHVQRLVAGAISFNVARPIASISLLLCLHAKAHTRFDLKLDNGLMTVVELVTEVLTHQLLLVLFHVNKLLFFQNALQDLVTRSLVHVKNFFSYNSIYAFRRQMVEHVPVCIFVQMLVPEGLYRVFRHI